jgi:DNA polymerase eta
MRGDDAKKVCPEIELIQVPVAHGKADLTQYRDAGSEVLTIFCIISRSIHIKFMYEIFLYQ